jgi:hypothetical protein
MPARHLDARLLDMDWADTHEKVAAIDTVNRAIYPAEQVKNYGYRQASASIFAIFWKSSIRLENGISTAQPALPMSWPPNAVVENSAYLTLLGPPLIRFENTAHLQIIVYPLKTPVPELSTSRVDRHRYGRLHLSKPRQ